MKASPLDVDATEVLSLGELKALLRENHLCMHCAHKAVCKVASSIDPEMLLIVSQCMAFTPLAAPDGAA